MATRDPRPIESERGQTQRRGVTVSNRINSLMIDPSERVAPTASARQHSNRCNRARSQQQVHASRKRDQSSLLRCISRCTGERERLYSHCATAAGRCRATAFLRKATVASWHITQGLLRPTHYPADAARGRPSAPFASGPYTLRGSTLPHLSYRHSGPSPRNSYWGRG